MEENKIVSLDLWGGKHIFNKNDLTYYLDRDCGLFSNITVSMYGIMKFYSLGLIPEKLSFILNEYDRTTNIYDYLFKTSNKFLDFNDINKEEMYNFLRYTEPNFLGLGRKKNDINFKIFERIIKKYFNLSNDVENQIQDIIKRHNINLNNTVFIWARKTDKVREVSIPSESKYVEVLKNNNLLNYDIILQTDDKTVVKNFEESLINFRMLDELPYSLNNRGFHERLSERLDEKSFILEYKMNKIEYLQKLLSLLNIATMSQYSIVYPGNLTTFIPIIKGNFNNCISFINDKDLFS